MTEGVSGTGISGTSPLKSIGTGSSPADKTVGRDEFLKLLTYQLRSQNPLKPYNNQEFATQLAQFSQLEQLTSIKSLLEEQVSTNLLLTQTISNTALPGMLGKVAKAFTNEVNFDGDNSVDLGFKLPYPASSGKISIYDATGNLVRTIDLNSTNLKRGEHTAVWDGSNFAGEILPDGKYTFKAEFTDSKGAEFAGDTFITGEIESVRFKTEGTVLVINGLEIPLQNIADISTRG